MELLERRSSTKELSGASAESDERGHSRLV